MRYTFFIICTIRGRSCSEVSLRSASILARHSTVHTSPLSTAMAHVISCRFLRLGCSEENHPLFRREYARSNRERGVKLLRCFPHCCPEHLKRSYCGCSVHVLVTFSTDVRAMMLDDILVCARFEPSRVAPLWPESLAGLARDLGAAGAEDLDNAEENCSLKVGETVSLPVSLCLPRREQDDGAGEVWIRAERESDEKQQAFPKNAVLYILNNGISPKWFYSYDSSVTRTQREMTHHLVVYTFRLQRGSNDVPLQLTHHGEDDNGMHQSAVLARHASPGFLLVSYRRSRASDNPGCTPPVVDRPRDNVEALNVASPSWMQGMPLQTRLTQTEKAYGHADKDVGYQRTRKTVETGGEFGISEAHEDSSLWQLDAQVRYPGFREKGQHLLILWWFLQCISVEESDVGTGPSNTHEHSYWLRVAATLRNPLASTNTQLEGIMESFLREIFGNATQLTREDAAIQMTMRLFLRALCSCTVQRLIRSAFQVHDATNTTELHERFAFLISCIYDFLNGVVRETSTSVGTKNASLSTLVDEVLSLVYGQTHFGLLRVQVSALLMEQQTLGSLSDNLNRAFRSFMTQTMLCNQGTKHQLMRAPSSSKSSLPSAWNCRWLLEPGSLEFIDGTQGSSLDVFPGLHFVDVVHSIREFGCVDVKIAENMSYLTVRSVLSILGDNTSLAPMELVLDGRLRPINILPSGLLATIGVAGRWLISDYAAVFSDGGQSLDIDVFALGLTNTRVSVRDDVEETKDRNVNYGRGANDEVSLTALRRVCLTLSLEQESSGAVPSSSIDPRDLFVLVHGGITGTTYQPSQQQHATGQGDILKLPIEDRAALFESLQWSPLMELQAGYIAIQRSRS